MESKCPECVDLKTLCKFSSEDSGEMSPFVAKGIHN